MPRSYWYLWWAGATAYLVMGALAAMSAVDVALSSQVALKGWMTWLFLMALGLLTSGTGALRHASFYWSLACLVLAAALPLLAHASPDLPATLPAVAVLVLAGGGLLVAVRWAARRGDTTKGRATPHLRPRGDG